MFQSPLNFKALCSQDLLLPCSQIRGLNTGGLATDMTLHRCEHLFLPVSFPYWNQGGGMEKIQSCGRRGPGGSQHEEQWQKCLAKMKSTPKKMVMCCYL